MKDKIKNLLSKRFHLPKAALIEEAVGKFSVTEKFIFYSLAGVLCLSAGAALWQVNESFMVELPSRGGTITEGVIGLPRFINPLLSISDADRDLTALVYSGLLKATPQGTLVPDLAESYSISADGLTYTFTLKPNLFFQDNTPLSADDVVFTIEKAQDPGLKSPKRPNWDGATVEKVSDRQIKLTLKQPYSPFLENATLGILPKHIWNSISDDEFQFSRFNTAPIGSGPYKLKSVNNNASGIPLYYRLEPFNRYVSGEPYVKNFIIRFYQNNADLVAAYDNGIIESMTNISPREASDVRERGGRVESTPLPRIFAVFFNQNNAPVLADKEVREALNMAVDKQAIVDGVLQGEGVAIDSPIPPGLLPSQTPAAVFDAATTSPDERVAAAKKILENAGWKLNSQTGVYEKKTKKETVTLSFAISTSNAPELKVAAMMLKDMWAKIGAKVEVKVFDIGELNQNVIRARKYDALLFGEIIGRDLDLFAFWHSSQRNDPGLNVALYASTKADKILETARTLSDPTKRLEQYTAFENEVKNDVPAVFLYSPDFLYVVPKKLLGFDLGHITVPAERFLGVNNWYVETENVWKIFAPKQ